MLYRTAANARARTSTFELWSWFFMRVSGVLLAVLAVAHMAIMHIFTPTEQVNYAFVVQRYSTSFWRSFDLVLLFLGILHGMNGARVVVDDYVHSRGWRIVAMSTLYVVTFIFLVIGAEVILAFQPQAASQ
ncbi:MAG: succinate dehydrogenase, hydrophobic membrane anchor protein [Sphingomonadaceae bacterium]